MIQIGFVGDWRKVKRLLPALPLVIKAANEAGQKKAAEQLVTLVKRHIRKQDLGWAEKSENTRASDDRVLVDSGTYLKSILAYKQGNTWNAGVPRNIYGPNGTRVADYAIYNEFGFGSRLPARPLWGPSLKEMGGQAGIQKIIFKVIKLRVAALISTS